MGTVQNYAEVQNQVGGGQTVQGSLFFGAVNNITNNIITAEDTVAVKNEDILESLAFPGMFDRRSNIEQPYANTCQWILDSDEYREWLSQPSGLLWVKGKPGAGKSTLMAHICRNHCTGKEGVRLEFFFNARGTPMQQLPIGMLRSIFNQLLRQDPESCSELRKEYEERFIAVGRVKGVWEWQRRDLERLLIQAIADAADKRPVTIFVDALDEAGQQSGREVAQYLHRINNRVTGSSVGARICISSRHYPVPPSATGREIWVEDRNGNDIATFVREHLRLDQRDNGDTPYLDDWQKLANELINGAHGVFQWIRLVTPMIEQYIDEGESPQDVREWLKEVPEDLSEIYDLILRETISERNRTMSFLLFQWVCLSMRPLSLSEIRCALAASEVTHSAQPEVPYYDTKTYLQSNEAMRLRIKVLSGGLIETTGERTNGDQAIQVIHQSVKEFIVTEGLVKLASLKPGITHIVVHSDMLIRAADVLRQCHSSIYWSCLRILAAYEWETLSTECYEETTEFYSGVPLIPVSLRERINLKSPLLFYASFNVFRHADEAGEHIQDMLPRQVELIEQFLSGLMLLLNIFEVGTIRKQAHSGMRPLHLASSRGLRYLFDHILKSSDSIDIRDDKGYTALHHAIMQDHGNIAERLVHSGADLHAKTLAGLSPLMLAVANRCTDIVTWLIDQEAEINYETIQSGNALQAAAENGGLMTVKALIVAGADVNARTGYYDTAVQAASYRGQNNVVEFLIDAGADVNLHGGQHGTALHAAVYAGHESTTKALIRAGADVNAKRQTFGTPLQVAAEYSPKLSMISLLLAAGADVNSPPAHFGTVLHSVATKPRKTDFLERILAAGANVQALDKNGMTALHVAAAVLHNQENIHRLLEYGADVNFLGPNSVTALHEAASSIGNHDTLTYLIKAGAKVNAQGGKYCTVLQAAATHSYRNEKMVTELLMAGADPNLRGGAYTTALHATLCRTYHRLSEPTEWEVFSILLAYGADVNIRADRDLLGLIQPTALEIARHKQLHKVVQRFEFIEELIN